MKIKYHPEIDGLRAISVLAVIFYHADFSLFGHALFQGGFIGVDIFFVISGYLITSLILKEINQTNQFSFKNFYERRVRRILPVLFLVTIISSIVSYFILMPSSLVDYGKSILGVFLFSSNIYFWITGSKYGAESEFTRPMLHTWSLSIEEQFYILFPIFFIILIKFYKKNIKNILLIIFFISLLSAELLSSSYIKFESSFFRWGFAFSDKFSFYQLPSRIFELVAGSILSYITLDKKKMVLEKYPILNNIFPGLGIILIFYSLLFFNLNEIFHPGIITLIPIVGTGLVILFAKRGEFITSILSGKIFIFLGLISYSLYLWHYPIFAYLRYIEIFNNSILIKILAIILAITLSIISYHFIEKPFRKNIISLKKLILYILISVIILLCYNFHIFNTDGIKNRFPSIFSEELIQPKPNKLKETEKHIRDFRAHEFKETGFIGENIYLIGDSHAGALKYYLNQELRNKSYNFFSTKIVLYLNNFNLIYRKTKEPDKFYLENNEYVNKFLQENKNLIVIWNQYWSRVLSETLFDDSEGNKQYQLEKDKITISYYEPYNIQTTSTEERQRYLAEGIKLTGNNILKQGHILVLIYPVPEIGFSPYNSLQKNYFYNYYIKKIKEIPILSSSYDVYKKRNKLIIETLDDIKGPNVYRIYPEYLFCNTIIQNRCVTNNKEHLFYYDNNHLSLEGSKYVVNEIMKTIQQIKINEKN